MTEVLRKQVRAIILIGLGAFLFVNGCSWQPGSGGRHDRKPGMEMERYFGWPACFYVDLWRSDDRIDGIPLDYMWPLPITGRMQFVYHSFGVVPLMIDAALVLAATGIAVILCITVRHGRMPLWLAATCVLLAVVVLVVFTFGEKASVYL
jgi:hypothetical protein